MRQLNWKTLLLILVIGAIAVSSLVVKKIDVLGFQRGTDEVLGLQLGLDLAGGVHLVYQAGEANAKPTDDAMDGLIRVISTRVDKLGATEPNIQRLGDNKIIVQLPGQQDLERAKGLIGETASLSFKHRVCQDLACSQFTDQDTGLTGEDLASASYGADQVTGENLIRFTMSSDATSDFGRLTQDIFNTNATESPDQLAVVLDEEVLVSARIDTPILSGDGSIRGRFTPIEARDIAIQLESGRLPIPITPVTESLIAASLGEETLEDSLLAGSVGLVLVLLFMVVYYRMSGFVAGLALVYYAVLALAIFKLFPITLTLAGIAGFILSMGMAVDANVLIFERMKEEIRVGRSLASAIQIGFNRAWTSIYDGNITTLLTALILFWFGSQFAAASVKGFALGLSIGVIVSMFTAVTVSKALLVALTSTPLRRLPGIFSPEGAPKITRDTSRPTQTLPERGS